MRLLPVHLLASASLFRYANAPFIMKVNFEAPMQKSLQELAAFLRAHDNFLITAHVNPDGDAIGSMFGMAYFLRALGKRCALFNISGINADYHWLNDGFPLFQNLEDLGGFHPETLLVLDCGDEKRAGDAMQALLGTMPSASVDHHLNNPLFATVNLVDSTAAATGELMCLLADELGITVTGQCAEALYMAIATDSGFFRFGNTTKRTMHCVATLLENGLNLGTTVPKISNTWSANRLLLWGHLLQNVSYMFNGKLAYVCLPRLLFDETGTESRDTEGLVNMIQRVKGITVAMTVREESAMRCKISLRSWGDVDVRQVAAHFGGGGHLNAAGCELAVSMGDAVQEVSSALNHYLGLDRSKE